MGGLSNYIWGCKHRNTSRPFTTRNKVGAGGEQKSLSETYIVCLDCGKKFPYSWEEMKVLRNKPASEDDDPTETNGVSRWLTRSAEWLTRRDRTA